MKKCAIAVSVLVVFGSVVLLVGCGGGSSTGGGSTDPQAVARAFWVAAMKHDVNATWDMFSSVVKTGFGNKAGWEAKMYTNSPQAKVSAGKASVSGDTASVPVKITSGGQEVYSGNVSLVKENGVWKIQVP